MPKKIPIGISACLLGGKVRYDGGQKLDHYLRDTLGQFVEWVPVCPEVESGLPVPREAMQLQGDSKSPRLVTSGSGIDHTGRMTRWAVKKLVELENRQLCGFVFKSRSPSSGMQGVTVYDNSGKIAGKSAGIFAKAFIERFPFIPAEDEGRLQDPGIRENFIERVFVFRRWLDFLGEGGSVGSLVAFHSDHKLLVMSHSIVHLRELGALLSRSKRYPRSVLVQMYCKTLMEGLRLHATVRKHTNVLQHMAGYFKKLLPAGEKKELSKVIMHYREGLLPLVVPVTLLKHYANKFDEPYLKRQHYLDPHPLEQMLRNHV